MTKHSSAAKRRSGYMKTALIASILTVSLVVALFSYYNQSGKPAPAQPVSNNTIGTQTIDYGTIIKEVYPNQGFALPAKWDGAPKQLVDSGALNLSFVANALNSANQSLTKNELRVLNGTGGSNVTLNKSSALFTLYVLWALGINNKNPIISNGPIMNYGGSPYNLASTGGYGPLGKLQLGNLSIITLNSSEQEMVEAIASNTYRPCCNNPAMFPDCNHGAAQLGLIELMASQGKNQTQIYDALKEFNSFYYPQQYLNVAIFFSYTQNKAWDEVPANVVLGYSFSSASGYYGVYNVLSNDSVLPEASGRSGGSCSA